MAVIFGNKGKYAAIYDALSAAGIHIRTKDGVQIIRGGTEAQAQAVVDAFNEVQAERDLKNEAIRAEGLSRLQGVFPAIQTVDDLDLIGELWGSIAPAARQPTAKITSAIAIYSAAKQAIAAVNAATTVEGVQAVVVAWP